ncbi:lambda-crystallin homolog [Ylistrum balloti]|uniref:lambda-crystallin homolog n=1 Tax=Ylistrum balloti TaxID=509963 RepID=UPI0029059F7F|nr:lambda-crystallin homolog [Ylistrum balloti]
MAAKQGQNIAIIGSGIIGRNWAMVFASGGYNVRIFDNDQNQIRSALVAIKETLERYEKDGILKGTDSASDQITRIRGCSSVEECVSGAAIVLECVPERLHIKRSVLDQVDRYINDDDVILASSSSAIFASALSEGMQHKRQVIVTHPLNPPYFLPFVEVVPAPWTDKSITERTCQILTDVGMTPAVLHKETKGFLICRVQHAITAECFKLVRDGVVSPEDIDKLMPHGLGRRYAFLGALEASYLNANGMTDFCKRYGDTIYDLQQDFGPPIKLEGAPLEIIEADLTKRIPLDQMQEKRDWRDKNLADLDKFLSKTKP